MPHGWIPTTGAFVELAKSVGLFTSISVSANGAARAIAASGG